jgi:FkbM family methyltransferase
MSVDQLKQALRRLRGSHAWAAALLWPASAVNRALYRRKELALSAVALRLADLLAEDPVLTIAEFEGTFQVSAKSDLFRRIAIHGSYEPKLSKLACAWSDPRRDVIDVGANIGFFSVFLARHRQSGSRVLACEPTPGALRRLRANIERNAVGHAVEVFAGIVSSAEGMFTINSVTDREEYSSVGSIVHPSAASFGTISTVVEGLPLDDLAGQRALAPGFLKIDVEGFEHHVLKGASRLLQTQRPVILCELNDPLLRNAGSSASEVLELLAEHRYTVFNADDPELPLGTSSFGDMIAFPSESHITKEQVGRSMMA